MSSGRRRLIYNFRERVISNDFNRQQAFKDAAAQQLIRFLYDDTYENWLTKPGQNTQHSVVGAPLRSVVAGGLIPEPVAGTQINVSAGCMLAIFPAVAGSTDDSPYVFVDDEGSNGDPAMVFTANAGPGIRIDVIECQPVDTVTATDNRDVFDPTTGLFSPVTVNKVAKATLQYRIRLGVQGAGYPGHASGWLPLAIASVPSGSVDWSTCTFWDVRPLISDRASFAAADQFREEWTALKGYAILSMTTDGRLTGAITTIGNPIIEHALGAGADGGGYVCGGKLYPGVPGIGDIQFFDMNVAGNLVAGFAPVNGEFYAVSAFFPHELPRWVRYNSDPATFGGRRLPWGTRGILQVHRNAGGATVAVLESGFTGTNVTLNASTGILGPQRGICLFTAVYQAGFGMGTFRDGEITLGNEFTLPVGAFVDNGLGGGITTMNFSIGGTMPYNVFDALITFRQATNGFSGGATGSEQSTIQLRNNADTDGYILEQKNKPIRPGVGGELLDNPSLWVPVPHGVFPNDEGSTAFKIKYRREFADVGGAPVQAASAWTVRAIRIQP